MKTSSFERVLSSALEQASSNASTTSTESNGNLIIIIAISTLALLGFIPIAMFIYSYIRRDAIERAREERRRQRIEALLGDANATDTKSPWQQMISSISTDRLEDALCKLMNVFSWNSVSRAQNGACCSAECSNAECAICICEFEDGDEVVESSLNVVVDMNVDENIEKEKKTSCVHRFHKKCMVEWLLLSKEPICPCCRRVYLNEGRIVEEGLIIEKNKGRERQVSDVSCVTLDSSTHSHESV